MFMVEIWVNCGLPLKFGRPQILQLPILGTLAKTLLLFNR